MTRLLLLLLVLLLGLAGASWASTPITSLASPIEQPGRYHLVGPLPGGPLSIRSSWVEVDLSGYAILGSWDQRSLVCGIEIAPRLTGVTVRNGSVIGHLYAVRAEDSFRLRLEDLDVAATYAGLFATGVAPRIESCTVREVSGVDRSAHPTYTRPQGVILAGDGALMRDCHILGVIKAEEAMGLNLMWGRGVRVERCSFARTGPYESQTFGVWNNARSAFFRDCDFAGWATDIHTATGGYVAELGLLGVGP